MHSIRCQNALISVTIINYGSLTDAYNFSLYWEITLLNSWSNETLEAGKQKIFTYFINAVELAVGNYSATAKISVLHNGSIFTDEVVEKLRVIGTPQLSIVGPNNGTSGETVSFTVISNHTDPYSKICNYTWALYAPGETQYRALEKGENVTFYLHYGWPEGDWIIALAVKDNYGIEYDLDRPATSPYRIIHVLSLNPPIIQPPIPPTLTTSPSEGAIGSRITIYGENFTPGTSFFITFEDLLSLSSVFSIVYVEKSGAFNLNITIPVVNSGNYTIKAIGSSYYYSYQTIASVGFRVTKGLDTLFEELEALREAINQIEDDDQCNEEDQSNTNGTIDGDDESTQTNIDSGPSDNEEILETAESILFESRIYVLIATVIAVIALLISGITILRRR